MKKFFSFLTRVDVFNRVLVLVSLIAFLIFPSVVLYKTNPSNEKLSTVMPSILLLGIVLGNGLLSLLRPLKSTWLFFLICILSFPFIFLSYDVSELNLQADSFAVFWISMGYSLFCFFIESFYLRYALRRKSKMKFNEKTNNDNVFDFLGPKKKNISVSQKLDEAVDNDYSKNIIAKMTKTKLSRVTRVVSFIVTYVICIFYFVKYGNGIRFIENQFTMILLLCLILLPLCLFFSLLYPYDFKYMYYFNVLFFSLCEIIVCGKYNIESLLMIFSIILSGLSFLVTLIVEGRTWTGANPD